MARRTRHHRTLAALGGVLLLLPLFLSPPAAADPADDPITTSTTLTVVGGIYTNLPVTLTATVTSPEGIPVGSVVFGGDATPVTVPLGANGTAVIEAVPTREGLNEFTAHFIGSDGWAESSAAAQRWYETEIVLEPEPTIARLTFPGLSVNLSMRVRVRDNTGAPLTGRQVTFSLRGAVPSKPIPGPGAPGPTIICTAVSGANGVATCTDNVAMGVLSSLTTPVWVTYTPSWGVGTNFYAPVPAIRF